MNVQPYDAAEEIKRLQRCLNDLVSLFALPAMWSGGEPSQIVNILLDALLRMLQLDFVYVRLMNTGGQAPMEMLRFARSYERTVQPPEIGEVFNHRFGAEPHKWPPLTRIPIAGRDMSIMSLGLGMQGEIGEILAGSERADFPQQTERMILSVAANQASIGLQGARLLTEQKHVASELDRRVGQRTSELAKANEELRIQVGLLQHIPVAAWTLEPDGTPDFVNQTWLEYTGQPLDYLRSDPESWMDSIHPEDRSIASDAFWRGVRSGQDFTFEARFRRVCDGTYRWHLNRAVLLRGAAGEIIRFVGTATDIDDLKQFRNELRSADERTRLIVETALDAVVTMNSQGLITSWNKQAEITFGWSPEEAIGQPMANMIIPEQHRIAHGLGLRRFLETGEGPILRRRIEIIAVRRSGAEFPVELEVVPLKIRKDWVFSAFIRDITESKLAEERLREAQEDLRNTQAQLAHTARVMTMGELTASIAHEVNQPLSAIIASGDSCAAWLANDPPNLDKARAATSRMIQAATQASEIVHRLRALFKKTTSMAASVDMNAVIEDTISLVHHEAERNKIFVRTDLHPGVPFVSGDRVQLQQVILNLAMNGIESTSGLDGEPKRLMIRSKLSSAGELVVSVEDTGLGIEPGHSDRLFAPFFTTKPHGIGMGLPICRSIVEAHGGRLWAANNEPRGAAFHFALPVTVPST